MVHEDIKMRESTTVVHDKKARKKKTAQPTEITDADALSESSGLHSMLICSCRWGMINLDITARKVVRQASQVIDVKVEQPDSSRCKYCCAVQE
jgi:hypothetical protein